MSVIALPGLDPGIDRAIQQPTELRRKTIKAAGYWMPRLRRGMTRFRFNYSARSAKSVMRSRTSRRRVRGAAARTRPGAAAEPGGSTRRTKVSRSRNISGPWCSGPAACEPRRSCWSRSWASRPPAIERCGVVGHAWSPGRRSDVARRMDVGRVGPRPCTEARRRPGCRLGKESVGRPGRSPVTRCAARGIAAGRTGGTGPGAYDPRAAELTGMRCRRDLRVAAVV